MMRNDFSLMKKAIGRSQILYAGILVLVSCLYTYEESTAADFDTGHYEIKSTTVMPHLDEMRRNVKQERICIPDHDVAYLFPVLRYAAFEGCRVEKRTNDNGEQYDLICPGPNGAKGSISLKAHQSLLRGHLQTKMGGKNMTFSQFIEAKHLGACPG